MQYQIFSELLFPSSPMKLLPNREKPCREACSGFQLSIKYRHRNPYTRLWLAQRKPTELVGTAVSCNIRIGLSTLREDEFSLDLFSGEIW